MTRIAVIGAGFLGHALAVGAAYRTWTATVVGRSDPFSLRDADPGPGEISLITGDAVHVLPRVIEQQDVEAIVIAAGGRFPVPSKAEPAADAIETLSLVIGVCELVASRSPRTRIVFLSSAGAVYSTGDELRSESDPGRPTSPYGMSRRMGEEYLEYYRRTHGLSTHVLRLVNAYGRRLPGSRGQGVVSAAFESALTGQPFRLYGDGRQKRDFIHVSDFVAALLDLLECDREIPSTINVGTGVGRSVVDVLRAVEAATGRTIETVPGPHSHTDTGHLAVDPSLVRTYIDFRPLDLEAGISLMAREVAGSPERV